MILRIGGNTCSKPYIVVRARPLGMRTVLPHDHGSLTWNTSLLAVPLCTVCANAGVLYRAAVCMNLDDTSPVERTAVESTARGWAHRRYLNAMASGTEGREKEFRYITCRWLRFAGRLQEPARASTPHQAELDGYCRYMTEERGLAQATITTARSELPKFLKYSAGKALKQMRLADAEIFLAHLGEQGWTRHGIKSMAHIIRGFFKYGETQRWTKPGCLFSADVLQSMRQSSQPGRCSCSRRSVMPAHPTGLRPV
jgi:hypothetical protein